MYDPRGGRFLQTDPVGYADQNNLYAYVGNDPVNKTDPTGNEQGSYGADGRYYAPGDRPESEGKVHSLKEMAVLLLAYAATVTGPLFIPEAAPAVSASIRNATVVQNSGFTVNQTRALTSFFGKGADGAKAALQTVGKPGFSLPRGLSEKTLQTYRAIAVKAIEAGKPSQVQILRIQVIDKALNAIRD